MDSSPANPPPHRPFRNWLSLAGLVVALGSFFAFVLLFAIDLMAHQGNPYMGILAYVVAPGFLILGLSMVGLGAWLQHRHARRSSPGAAPHALHIDLSRPRDRRTLIGFVAGTIVFLLLTALGSYQTYHLTESTIFCGQACHEPMKPEYTTYLISPHARVACVECHVGSGTTAYLKAKINGVHQLCMMFTGGYERPIPTPVKNLRPARETCGQCHWPEKTFGTLDRTYTHFLADETNTGFTVRMLLHVGGGADAPGSGSIHWHANPSNKVEYVTTDPQRQVIPWVRVTDAKGEVTEFRSAEFKDDPSTLEKRTMDCLDCHNRPAHNFQTPNDSVDNALVQGRIDRSIPWVKSNLVFALTQNYATEPEALQKISAYLKGQYPDSPRTGTLVAEAQRIFGQTIFPEMKAAWHAYPDHSGHKEWIGCFRCHDGKHKTADGKRTLGASDCNSCHVILAQGAGVDLEKLNPKGHDFFHIDAPYSDFDCHTCHTGAFPK
jgi:nitrate/TMAO reductase-like tetraheme cytochrome c subunit